MRRTWLAISALVLVLGPSEPTVLLAAQSAASGIAGVVKDTSGAVMPGVTVEAASPALIEKVRTVVTDEQGQYKIVDLRPGQYSVTFSLTGFNAVKRDGMDIPAGFTATVNAELRVGALEETITVSGQAPTVDVQNVKEQKVLSQETLNALPTLRSPQSYVPYIPGVQGGLGQIGRDTAALAIHGTRSGESNVAIDGFEDHSFAGPGGGSFIYYINQGSVQEVTVEVSGQSAEMQMGGIRTNLVPKEGSNRFSGFFFAGYGSHATQADNLTDELKAQGLTAVNSLNKLWDYNPAWGGPLKKDKLWFYNAYRHWGSINYIAGLYYNATPTGWVYTPDLDHQATTRVQDGSSNLRLTWQVNGKHKLSVFYDNQPHCTCNRNFSATVSPEATQWAPFKPNQYAQATWKYTATNKVLIEAGVGSTFGNWQTRRHTPDTLKSAFLPNGVALDTVSATEQSTGIVFRADTSYSNNLQSPVIMRGSMTYVTGSHAAKVGVGSIVGRRIDTNEQAGAYSVRLNNGVPNQITQYASPRVAVMNVNNDFGAFAQDQWTINHLTLNMGVRFDYFNGSVPAQDEAALLARFGLYNPPWVQVRKFEPVKNIPNWKDLSPRLGGAWDIFGDGRTAIKASIGKYLAGQTVAIASANNPVNTSVTNVNRTWNDANRNFLPDCDLKNLLANGECQQVSNLNFGQANPNATRYADDVLHGYGARGNNWEFATSVVRELRPGWAVQAAYYRRWYGNFTSTQNTSVSPSDYGTYCVTAPVDSRLPGGGGNQICGFYDVNPNKFGQVTSLIAQSSEFGTQEDVYDGLDFTTNVRFPGGVSLQGGMNTGRQRTNNCFATSRPDITFAGQATGATAPRIDAFCDIRPPFQSQVKFFGVYPLPWFGLQTGATYQNLPGPQIQAGYVVSAAQIAQSLGRAPSSGGNATVDLIAPGTLYGARGQQLDANLKKLFRFGTARVSLSMDVFNILNRSDVLATNDCFGPNWLQPTNILGGRWMKFGAQFDF